MKNGVLNPQRNYRSLYFYKKSDVVYQLSFTFCDRYIHLYKDRTRDQIIQAARSCKQNIVEGMADGVTSTEMQLKLLNVARSSLQELREDFKDYLKSRHLQRYSAGHPAYETMLTFCRLHNTLSEYEPLFAQWNDEQMCNYAITLCHMIDVLMTKFMQQLEQKFITEGGIKERMHRARTHFREEQDNRLKALEAEVLQLKAQLAAAQAEAQNWHNRYDDLKSRALKAYYAQQEEITKLKAQLDELAKPG